MDPSLPIPRPVGQVHNTPPWIDPDSSIPLRPLLTNTTADVCVIGAGISGLTAAYELARHGRAVVVLDNGPIGRAQTLNTTAHLVTALDERYFEIERIQGPHGAALARESHAAAIDRTEAIINESSINCRFTRLPGHLFVPLERPNTHELLDRELAAARRAGAVVEKHDSTPQLGVRAPSLRFPNQAQLHPTLYLAGLARSARTHFPSPARIFTGTHVASFSGGPHPVVITDDNLRVSCAAIVVATNTLLREPSDAAPRQTPFCSYVISLRISPGSLSPALYWDGYWDEETPYHYARLAASLPAAADAPPDLLLVGGEDTEGESPNLADPRYERLEEWARTHFPSAGEVAHRWNGRILEPDDELALIGRHPRNDDNLFVISGDSGNGMTYAAIAGIMLPDLLEGRPHRWERLYDPRRDPVSRPTRRTLSREQRVTNP